MKPSSTKLMWLREPVVTDSQIPPSLLLLFSSSCSILYWNFNRVSVSGPVPIGITFNWMMLQCMIYVVCRGGGGGGGGQRDLPGAIYVLKSRFWGRDTGSALILMEIKIGFFSLQSLTNRVATTWCSQNVDWGPTVSRSCCEGCRKVNEVQLLSIQDIGWCFKIK